MRRLFRTLILLLLFVILLVGGGAVYYGYTWLNTPLTITDEVYDFQIERGERFSSVATKLEQAGVLKHAKLLVLYSRYTEQDRAIQAGAYEIRTGDTPRDLLTRLASGQMSQRRLALIEGRTTRQFIETIQANPDVRVTLSPDDPQQLLDELGIEHDSEEGLFFPDTYVFVPGDSDLDILRRAYTQGQAHLQQAWEQRHPDLPLNNPYELLIMASIVEKETGHPEDRALVAGVFMNRLKINMPLQTDPTVIYGMGERYQGRIRRVDLETDTPWNTYTRRGLPPTPIANVGLAALQAASQPAQHDYYYFVARGDGTSAFAKDLRQHNRNVRQYILKRGE